MCKYTEIVTLCIVKQVNPLIGEGDGCKVIVISGEDITKNTTDDVASSIVNFPVI